MVDFKAKMQAEQNERLAKANLVAKDYLAEVVRFASEIGLKILVHEQGNARTAYIKDKIGSPGYDEYYILIEPEWAGYAHYGPTGYVKVKTTEPKPGRAYRRKTVSRDAMKNGELNTVELFKWLKRLVELRDNYVKCVAARKVADKAEAELQKESERIQQEQIGEVPAGMRVLRQASGDRAGMYVIEFNVDGQRWFKPEQVRAIIEILKS